MQVLKLVRSIISEFAEMFRSNGHAIVAQTRESVRYTFSHPLRTLATFVVFALIGVWIVLFARWNEGDPSIGAMLLTFFALFVLFVFCLGVFFGVEAYIVRKQNTER